MCGEGSPESWKRCEVSGDGRREVRITHLTDNYNRYITSSIQVFS